MRLDMTLVLTSILIRLTKASSDRLGEYFQSRDHFSISTHDKQLQPNTYNLQRITCSPFPFNLQYQSTISSQLVLGLEIKQVSIRFVHNLMQKLHLKNRCSMDSWQWKQNLQRECPEKPHPSHPFFGCNCLPKNKPKHKRMSRNS